LEVIENKNIYGMGYKAIKNDKKRGWLKRKESGVGLILKVLYGFMVSHGLITT